MKVASEKIKVLVVEDDPAIMEIMKNLLEPYASDLEILETTNAGAALRLLDLDSSEEGPDALILDLMMPYGSGDKVLHAENDPGCIKTGVRLLEYLRQKEKKWSDRTNPLLWVSVITARSSPRLIPTLRELLENRGRIYFKPLNDIELEHDLALVLGLKSKAPTELLPPGYEPPKLEKGSSL